MSKAYSDSLYKLIQALSKTEKRYIKLYIQRLAGETYSYSRLFDKLASQKVYNEKRLLSFKHLAVMKVRLEENVLAGLQKYHSEKSISAKLFREIHAIEILFQKGLLDNALKQIQRSRKVATHYQEPLALFELVKWELKIINAMGFVSVSQEQMKEKYRHGEDHLKQAINVLQYSLFSNTVYLRIRKFGFFRTRAELRRFGRIMKNPMLRTEDKATLVEAKYYYYSTHIGYANLEGDYQKAYRNTNKILNDIN